jgi:hypothetical protein
VFAGRLWLRLWRVAVIRAGTATAALPDLQPPDVDGRRLAAALGGLRLGLDSDDTSAEGRARSGVDPPLRVVKTPSLAVRSPVIPSSRISSRPAIQLGLVLLGLTVLDKYRGRA